MSTKSMFVWCVFTACYGLKQDWPKDRDHMFPCSHFWSLQTNLHLSFLLSKTWGHAFSGNPCDLQAMVFWSQSPRTFRFLELWHHLPPPVPSPLGQICIRSRLARKDKGYSSEEYVVKYPFYDAKYFRIFCFEWAVGSHRLYKRTVSHLLRSVSLTPSNFGLSLASLLRRMSWQAPALPNLLLHQWVGSMFYCRRGKLQGQCWQKVSTTGPRRAALPPQKINIFLISIFLHPQKLSQLFQGGSSPCFGLPLNCSYLGEVGPPTQPKITSGFENIPPPLLPRSAL